VVGPAPVGNTRKPGEERSRRPLLFDLPYGSLTIRSELQAALPLTPFLKSLRRFADFTAKWIHLTFMARR